MTSHDPSHPERIDNPFATRPAPQARADETRSSTLSISSISSTSSTSSISSAPLTLRSMTGFEEEVVERLAGDPNTARLCNELVARCLVPPGDDHQPALARVRSMTVSERDLAIVAVRRLSLGDKVEAEVACPACRVKNDVRFALGDLGLVSIQQREVDVELPDGEVACLRLPTAGDQEALIDAGLDTTAQRRTWLIARTLLRLGGRAGPFDSSFARALPTATRRALEGALDGALPTSDLSMRVTCAACSHAFNEPFDVVSFFLPS